MRKLFASTLALAAALGVLASCNSDGKKETQASTPTHASESTPVSEPPLTLEETAEVRLSGKVKAIDYVAREVTLEDSSGHSVTLIAGSQIQRFNEVNVGDHVSANYSITLVAELRPATAEEKANPISAVQITSRNPKGMEPAGSIANGWKIVTTVERVDLGKMQVTLKGPLGDTTTVRARKTENIKKLHVGDTIVITYVKALAASLTKG